MTNIVKMQSAPLTSEDVKKYETEGGMIRDQDRRAQMGPDRYYDTSKEWFDRRCQRANSNPAADKCSTISDLQRAYSDTEYDVTFDVCASKKYADLWQHHAKFNVLISRKMLTELTALKDI